MRAFYKIFQSPSSPVAAIGSAFMLCGMYFASWYVISHYLSAGMANF